MTRRSTQMYGVHLPAFVDQLFNRDFTSDKNMPYLLAAWPAE